MKASAKIILFVGIALALGVCVKGFWFTEVFTPHSGNEANREAMRKLDAALEMGDSHMDVLAKFWNLPEHDLRIGVNSPEGWNISMPNEFLARNWIMNLCFDGGRLSRIEIRNAEGNFPDDAPPPRDS